MKKEHEFLLLAAIDMEEASAATSMLMKIVAKEIVLPISSIHQLEKALETAICVSYSRPFTKSNFSKPLTAADVPYLNDEQKLLHRELIDLRDWRYAHTDKEMKSHRTADLIGEPGSEGYGYSETWIKMNETKFGSIVMLCALNRDAWRNQVNKQQLSHKTSAT